MSDTNGRFVPGLRQDDFLVYEDDQPVTVTHFSAERVPVSLGIALDTSGSMAGDKIQEAQRALDRFLFDLLDEQDEIFLYRFSNTPVLLQAWTRDRQQLSRALGRIEPNGGTAMYDAVAEAIPLAQQGQNRKKALLVISDGNDTASATDGARAESADPRDRDARLRDRHRRRGRTDDVRRRRRRGCQQCRGRCRFPAPTAGGGAAPAVPASAADRRRRRIGRSERTTTASTSSRCAT